MKVLLHQPKRVLDDIQAATVKNLLSQLDLEDNSVLVIRNDELVTADIKLEDDDRIEIRPVISGG